MYFKEAGGMTLLVVNLQVKNINFRNMYCHCREMLPACRRLLFPLLHACNKGNRRRLHAGKRNGTVQSIILTDMILQEWIIKICCLHVYFVFPCRKAIFDAPPEDPNYQPLPEEDRPGGFNWGEGQRVGAEHEHDDWKKKNTKIENALPHTSLNQIIIMCSVRKYLYFPYGRTMEIPWRWLKNLTFLL